MLRSEPRKSSGLIGECGPLLSPQRPTLAVDPGASIGTAYALGRSIWLREIGPEALWSLLGLTTPETIICERYRVRPGQPGNPIALEVIGVIHQWVNDNGSVNLIQQDPAQGKAFWTNDKLKAYGLYLKGLPHARDALRHLLYYWTFKTRCFDLRQPAQP